MDINKHIVKADDDEIFHSSGYAQIANGNNLGSTSNVTFNQRLQTEKSRSVISSYRHSSLGGLCDMPRVRTGQISIEKPSKPIIVKKRPTEPPAPQPKKRGRFI